MKPAILVVFLVSLLGCGELDKLDRMLETTEKMEESTDSMKEKTDQLSGRTEELYTDMREVESLNAQREAFQLLRTTEGPTMKLRYGIIYFSSMEFQHWKAHYSDTLEKRERLFSKAVELFFAQIEDLVEEDFPIDPWFPSEDWIDLSVLAVTMSKVHPEQEALSKKRGFDIISFYDILKQGLLAKGDYEAGRVVPEYQRRVLENEKIALYLLQLRHNFFKAVVMGRLSQFEEGPWSRLIMYTMGWEVDLEDFNLAEIFKLNEWLWKSIETQSFLSQLGEPVLFNSRFEDLFSNGSLLISPALNMEELNLVEPEKLSLEWVYENNSYSLFLALLRSALSTPPKLYLKEL